MSEQGGGRRETSLGGLVGAMLVIVVLVLAVVVVRSLFRADADQGPPEAIDYLDSVLILQSNGLDDIVYPATLPDGWIVTEVGATPGERPTYRINLYTDDDKFVGLRQEDEDVDDLLDRYVDEDPTPEEPLTDVGDLAPTWEGWSDSGGDHAFTATVGETTVVAFGDVSVDELTELVAVLTDDAVPPVDGEPASPSPAG